MSCRATQERMSALLAGAADQRERALTLAHAAHCARCGTALDDFVATSVALDRAYAPLRLQSVALSPSRVRLALRVPQPVPAAVRFSRISARLTELGLAAAVTAFAFVGSASVAPKHAIVDEAVVQDAATLTHVTAHVEDQYFWRWIRLGRYAPQSDDLDPAVAPRPVNDDIAPITHERVGLMR
ncbi:MAG: zf-HC2 domain-containing protein [Candidatus Limnocylindria bacterium]|nr:zf-HC2 domain-containing protein [Candidatus Limnocylindria bacterium]